MQLDRPTPERKGRYPSRLVRSEQNVEVVCQQPSEGPALVLFYFFCEEGFLLELVWAKASAPTNHGCIQEESRLVLESVSPPNIFPTRFGAKDVS